MAQQVEATFKVLMKVSFRDGRNFYFHNFPNKDPNQIIRYQSKDWNYLPFDSPLGSQKMGEDNQSTRVTIQNIGSEQHGAFPLRDWLQDGTMDGCSFEFTVIITDQLPRQNTYTLAEKEFRDEYGNNSAGSIVLTLRQPDDGYATFNTATVTEAMVGTGIVYVPN